jgi:UDP-glucose 4-epimerase
MKVLVTGGSGFIGSHLVDGLVSGGYDVVVVDLIEFDGDSKGKVGFYKADMLGDKLEEIFERERPDIVFHLAANPMVRGSMEDPISDAKKNIIGTINVLECCKKNGVRKIIYTSTGGARVGEPDYLPVDEKHPIRPLSPYGISKHSAEHYVEMYGKTYGMEYFIFCFGNVYGPRDKPESKRLIPMIINKILNNENPVIFGDGNQTRDFVYVVDLVNFMIESINKNPGERLFHLASGEETSVNKIVSLIKEASHFVGEVDHVEEIKGEVREIVLNTDLAKEQLGWNSKTNIRDGINNTWEWFKDQKNKNYSTLKDGV